MLAKKPRLSLWWLEAQEVLGTLFFRPGWWISEATRRLNISKEAKVEFVMIRIPRESLRTLWERLQGLDIRDDCQVLGQFLDIWDDCHALGQLPDENLFRDIIIGCRLSGWMTDSQVLKNLPRPPKLTLEALLKTSLGLQKSVLKRVRAPEEP